jgi:hypothetical protein
MRLSKAAKINPHLFEPLTLLRYLSADRPLLYKHWTCFGKVESSFI